VWHGDDTGDPHGSRIDPALDAVTVGEVLAAVHVATGASATTAALGRG
jgi:hypothetical protein